MVLGFNYCGAILLLRGGREKGKHRASEGVCPRAAHKKEFPFPAGKGLKRWGVVHVLTKGKCIIIYGKRGDNPPRLVPFFEAALFFIECITEA